MSDVRNAQQFFHVAPREARSSIERHGIDYRRGTKQWEGIDYPKGNYVLSDETAAFEYGHERETMSRDDYGEAGAEKFDMYQVAPSKKLNKDPLALGNEGFEEKSFYTKEPLQVVKRLPYESFD